MPTFVHEFPIKTLSQKDASLVEKRFKAAQYLYNSLLREGLKRYDHMRERKAYWEILKSSKSLSAAFKGVADFIKGVDQQDRSLHEKCTRPSKLLDKKTRKPLSLCHEETSRRRWCCQCMVGRWSISMGFLSTYAANGGFGDSWIGDHLCSVARATIAQRVEDAIMGKRKYHSERVKADYVAIQNTGQKPFGEKRDKRRPRFKKDPLESIEGMHMASGPSNPRLVDSTIHWSNGNGPTVKRNILLDLDFAEDDITKYVCSCPLKYVRLCRREIRGAIRYYAQFVLEGLPYRSQIYRTGSSLFVKKEGVVGFDMGPQTIAIVSETAASIEVFCDQLVKKQDAIKKLEKKASRQYRANNPDRFEEDRYVKNKQGKMVRKEGKHKSRKKHPDLPSIVRSKAYKKTRIELQEWHRKQVEHRKCLHGALVNRMVEMGDQFNFEDISIRAWQKMFGRSVGFRAPGMFLSKLKQKLDGHGISYNEFSTRTTALSQVCHCGRRAKKKLSQRWHKCPQCGTKAQRDLYSAWLARFVVKDELIASQAALAWPGAAQLLQTAIDSIKTASCPASVGVKTSATEPSSEKRRRSGKHRRNVGRPTPQGTAESRTKPSDTAHPFILLPRKVNTSKEVSNSGLKLSEETAATLKTQTNSRTFSSLAQGIPPTSIEYTSSSRLINPLDNEEIPQEFLQLAFAFGSPLVEVE